MFLDCINHYYGKKEEITSTPLGEGDAKLFDSVFTSYIPFSNDFEKIKLNDEHKEYFLNLEQLYKEISWEDGLSSEEELADALMFYISSGLVTKENNDFYVDSVKLIEKTKQYECYREKRKGLK